jgi:hypothetical protein
VIGVFLAPFAVFGHDELFFDIELVFTRDIVLALAGLTNESDQNALFFLSHNEIFYTICV